MRSFNDEDESDVESVLTVLAFLREHETDYDHIFQLAKSYGAVIHRYGDIVTHRDATPTQADVDTALEVLDTHGEKYGRDDDEWTVENDLHVAWRTIDMEVNHTSGPLDEVLSSDGE